ncbi:MAG TPA: response regulator [Anaeromyxobacteraceae bacterium]|nr:response regulator [Anaeromyxobacteraceae bacterium]
MPKKILLVDSDAALAANIGAALQARGAELALARDAGSVLELARAERPDAFVLCAELPGGSGFVLCNKLRKEPDLKDIPLLLTSAAATEETFEQHRKLKTRADAYLKKPFAITALLEKLAPLAGLAGLADDAPDAPGAPDDDDLLAFDAAFDSIAQVDAASGPIDHPISSDEIDAAAALVADLPDVHDEPPARVANSFAGAGPFPQATPSAEATPIAEPTPPAETAAELETLRGEIARLRAEVDRLRAEADRLGGEVEHLRGEGDRLRAEADHLRGELSRANAASAEQVTAERARIRAALAAALASLDRS